jgi:hypothetical protein
VKSSFKLLIWVMTILVSVYGDCRGSNIDTLKDDDLYKKNKYRIALTPTSLLNTFFGPQVNHTFNINRAWDVRLETGLILFHPTDEKNLLHGYRLRPSINYHLFRHKNDHVSLGLFYHHRHTIIARERSFSRADGQYNETITGDWRNTRNGLGLMLIVTEKSENLVYNVGLGACRCFTTNRYSDEELRPQAFGWTFGTFPFADRYKLTPTLILNFSIGF